MIPRIVYYTNPFIFLPLFSFLKVLPSFLYVFNKGHSINQERSAVLLLPYQDLVGHTLFNLRMNRN